MCGQLNPDEYKLIQQFNEADNGYIIVTKDYSEIAGINEDGQIVYNAERQQALKVRILLLLLVSTISVNSIASAKRLKTYAIYRICGLSGSKCAFISVLKSVYISFFSIIICCVFFAVKEKCYLFDEFIMNFGLIQTVYCFAFLTVNIIVSYAVCRMTIQRNELNCIIKEN